MYDVVHSTTTVVEKLHCTVAQNIQVDFSKQPRDKSGSVPTQQKQHEENSTNHLRQQCIQI